MSLLVTSLCWSVASVNDATAGGHPFYAVAETSLLSGLSTTHQQVSAPKKQPHICCPVCLATQEWQLWEHALGNDGDLGKVKNINDYLGSLHDLGNGDHFHLPAPNYQYPSCHLLQVPFTAPNLNSKNSFLVVVSLQISCTGP